MTLEDFIDRERQAAERMEPSPGTAVALLLDRLEEWANTHYSEELATEYERGYEDAERSIEYVERDLDYALDLLADNAAQFLMEKPDGTLHHSFMAIEEATCTFLVELNRLKQVGRASYRWVK